MQSRDAQIFALYKSGKTLQEIGNIFGFSRARAQQIIIKEVKSKIKREFNLGKLSGEEKILLDVAVREEMQEIVLKSRSSREAGERERIGRKIEAQPFDRFTVFSDYAKALGENHALIRKYFPEIADSIVSKRKRLWSLRYNRCRICKTTSAKHKNHGICEKCYPKSDLFKEMNEASRLRNLGKRKKYQELYQKRPEVLAKRREYSAKKACGGNRNAALKRDKFRCRECGWTQVDKKARKELFVFHTGDKNNHELENLITLCRKCFYKMLWQKRRRSVENKNREL